MPPHTALLVLAALPPRVRLVPRAAAAAALAALAACGGTTDPDGGGEGTPGIQILAGAEAADTVEARLAQALRVAVRDASGRPLAGAVVRFDPLLMTVSSPYGPQRVPSLYVGRLDSRDAGVFAAETTSTRGVVNVAVRLGTVVGAAGVVVSVPEAGFVDTARFTVQPGNAAEVDVAPGDTAVRVGSTLALAANVLDRFRNRRPDAVTFRVAGAGLAVTAAGQVSASAPARAAVVASGAAPGAKPDTAWVSAVPAGTVAARRRNKLVIVALDGSAYRELALTLEPGEPSPEWHPDGQSLLSTLGTFASAYPLHVVDLQGAARPAFPTQPSNGLDAVPGPVRSFTYSADGQWLYLSGNPCNGNGILFRIRAGSDGPMERLSPPPPAGASAGDCFDTIQNWPSPSPDGTRVAFENATSFYDGYTLRVLDAATRAVTPLGVTGRRPRWSPKGDLIAYWHANQIWVVKPDGTGPRAVSPAGMRYVPGVSWSPDGRYLLARFEPSAGNASTTVALLDVATGLAVPIPFFSGYDTYSLPAWRPVD